MAKKKLSAAKQELISASDSHFYLTTLGLAKQYLTEHPEDLRALLDLGFACTHLRRFSDARSAFQRALDVSEGTEHAAIYGLMGNCLQLRGDIEAAIDCFKKQISSAPTDAEGYVNLGSLYFRQGDFETAQATLEQGLTCESGFIEDLFYTLGIVFLAQEKIYPAIDALQKGTRIDPQHEGMQTALKDAKKAVAVFGV